jgi:hypothetical protein
MSGLRSALARQSAGQSLLGTPRVCLPGHEHSTLQRCHADLWIGACRPLVFGHRSGLAPTTAPSRCRHVRRREPRRSHLHPFSSHQPRCQSRAAALQGLRIRCAGLNTSSNGAAHVAEKPPGSWVIRLPGRGARVGGIEHVYLQL